MSRIPLSDEDLALDDDIVEEEGSPGKEDQYDELDFNAPTSDPYAFEPEVAPFDEEDAYDPGNEWPDEWASHYGEDDGS